MEPDPAESGRTTAEAAPPALTALEVERFLSDHHEQAVDDVERLGGGYWSSAYGYRAGGRELVVRFGQLRHGFEADRAAMAFSRPDLPVPDVLHIGDAFGVAYAISVRHHGRFLEDVSADDVARARPTLARLLGALRSVSRPPEHDPSPWREWVLAGLRDTPGHVVSGWRRLLADDPAVDRVFRAAEARVHELIDACPERQDLVHGDLLHGNVLVAEDCSQVNAVYSWKCATWGDFLFDVAWCTFWGGYHPGIAEADAWVIVDEDPLLDTGAMADAPDRHHAYELQIGASHLGWHAWNGNARLLQDVAARTATILERGPRR